MGYKQPQKKYVEMTKELWIAQRLRSTVDAKNHVEQDLKIARAELARAQETLALHEGSYEHFSKIIDQLLAGNIPEGLEAEAEEAIKNKMLVHKDGKTAKWWRKKWEQDEAQAANA